jgi:iron-sulfur cluster assembly protein
MINLSETAAQRIDQLRAEEKAPAEAMLRVYVKRGGCSGFSYKMQFDGEVKETDKVFESFGAKIVIDGQSLLYLMGMTLDYEGGLNGKGFVFTNPNATKTCGCGTSFGV